MDGQQTIQPFGPLIHPTLSGRLPKANPAVNLKTDDDPRANKSTKNPEVEKPGVFTRRWLRRSLQEVDKRHPPVGVPDVTPGNG